ncbi:hypothetical protein P5_0032 [Aeromonas phage P5]|nr:hypothetical protein P5_0032 [Aeromonas phage P5]
MNKDNVLMGGVTANELARISATLKLLDVTRKLVGLTSATFVCAAAAQLPKLVVDGRDEAVDAIMGVVFGEQYERRTLCFDARDPALQEKQFMAEEHAILTHGQSLVSNEDGTAVIFGKDVCYTILVLPISDTMVMYLGGTLSQLTDLADVVTSSMESEGTTRH